ncbi:MAG TPA: UvrB/UvrC motif-containing protein, partial [Acetobacteraceae bacterium]|nr:UvrB/UvrC motif-containing protein [Acetobacteraceae bacterium]
DLRTTITELEKRMRTAAANLEFEEAARLRDEIKRLEALELGLEPPPAPTQIRARRDRTPEPMGPGGGGYDPAKMKRGRRRQGRG